MRRRSVYITGSLIIGVIIGLIIAARFDFSPPAETQSIGPTATADSFKDAVVNVAKTTGRAVVSISTERTTRFGGGGSRTYRFEAPFEDFFGNDDVFRRFFDDFFGGVPEREYRSMGLGSGTIIDQEGYILTNEHVISGADKISVTLPDGRKFNAEVKGKDTRSDLAVIKINARNLPVAELGNSDNLRIGDWVVAIGNPFGYVLDNPEPTVTAGVISALHRSLGRVLARDRDYGDLIQTDAAINPGNSGGPLVNLEGKVVGINVAIFSTTGGYQGIGFALPINSAKRIISRLISGEKILYGWMGVSAQDLTPELAEHFGVSDTQGALVAGVVKDGPAEKAGIKEGDIIRKFGDEEIENVRKLVSVVTKTEVGKKVNVLVLRDKKEIKLVVKVSERPEDLEKEITSWKETRAWRGMQVEEISPELAQRYRIEERQGVVIVNIEPASPASEANLIPGDVILGINREPVNNLSDYQRLTKDLKDSALIKTQRGYFLVKNE